MDIDILLKEFEKKGFDPMLNEIVLGRLAFVLKTLKKLITNFFKSTTFSSISEFLSSSFL